MEQDYADKPKRRPGSSHDRFAKKYLQYKAIVADLLRFYADPTVAEHVDVDGLQPAPTHGISDELKEVIMDISFVARLRDAEARSEVLFALEHKSSPSPRVALQVGTQAFLALYTAWTDAEYTDAKSFELPIPIMIVLYHGAEDWTAKEIQFQDLFKNIPSALRKMVPRFEVLVINLRRFQYGNLPGRPITKAFVESLMRAMDGTFAANLESVFRHIHEAGLERSFRWDYAQTVAAYCSRNDLLTVDRLKQVILKVFEGQEGIEMLETIPNGILQEGIEIGVGKGIAIGEVRGEVRGEIKTTLRFRFGDVPDDLVKRLSAIGDLSMLTNLDKLASTCASLDEFADAMK